MSEKICLLNLNKNEMTELVQDLNQPAFRGKQIYGWLQKGVVDFDEMTNVPKKLREQLKEISTIGALEILDVQESKTDGTAKYLLALPNSQHKDMHAIESVFMKYSYGNSICISSQVGCRMGCKFCASTRNGLIRNLTAGEMLGQVLTVERHKGEPINHIVVMGIGEPLENMDNLCRFLEMIHDRDGLNISYRNITVSTCGLLTEMDEFSTMFPQVNMAISLHAPNDRIRSSLMPIAKKYPIERVIEAAQKHTEKTGRRITFEYALINGVNDKEAEIRELAQLLRGLNCHVNLIPLNEVSETGFRGTEQKGVIRINEYLNDRGIQSTVRRKLGEDIDAACGQLRLKQNK